MSSSDSDDGPVRRGNVAIHSSGSTPSHRSESGNEAKNDSDSKNLKIYSNFLLAYVFLF